MRINLIVVLFLTFICSIQAQNSLKTGNIRECATWTAGATELNNPVINSGHVVASNANPPFVNSITFNGTGSLNLNGSDNVIFGSPTSMAPCYLNLSNSNTYGDMLFNAPSSPVESQSYAPITISGLSTGGAKITVRVRFEFGAYPLRYNASCASGGDNMYFTVYLGINGVASGSSFTLTGSRTSNVANEMTLNNISVSNGDVLSVVTYPYNTVCSAAGGTIYAGGVTTTGILTISPSTQF